MNSRRQSSPDAAFTRLDLLAVLVILAVLAAVVRPALAGLRPRSDIAVCSNNLRQIGRAFELWGSAHDGGRPWGVTREQGGTRGSPSALVAEAYFQFLWLSNELATPRLLVCPSDSAKSFASGFGGSGMNSLMTLRVNAISYFLGPDAPPAGALPAALLSGDRNLTFDGYGACVLGIFNVAFLSGTAPGGSGAAWTNALHYPIGNVLLNDGRVVETSTQVLRQQILPTAGNDNGVVHLLSVRGQVY